MPTKRKPAEPTVETTPEASTPAAVTTTLERQPGDDPAQTFAAVQAPPKGAGDAFTIDNRTGYRKEDSPDGRGRQIRFADREGGQRPDDELLAPVREEKPAVSWASKEKAWRARKTPEGLEAIDSADQKLREIGAKRSGGSGKAPF